MGSRGRGRVQRYVRERAAALGRDEWLTSMELATGLYGEATRARTASVTRAINLLADRGEVIAELITRHGHVVLAVRGEDRG